MRFVELIERSSSKPALKQELHELRKFRNRWVHVSDPRDHDDLLNDPEKHEAEFEAMARRAIRALRETIYENQWV